MKKTEWTWAMHAEEFLRYRFLPRTYGQVFLVEQFRKASEKAGLPQPADLHQYGSFFTAMKKAGHIRTNGFGIDQYGSPKSLWRRV